MGALPEIPEPPNRNTRICPLRNLPTHLGRPGITVKRPKRFQSCHLELKAHPRFAEFVQLGLTSQPPETVRAPVFPRFRDAICLFFTTAAPRVKENTRRITIYTALTLALRTSCRRPLIKHYPITTRSLLALPSMISSAGIISPSTLRPFISMNVTPDSTPGFSIVTSKSPSP